MLKPHKITLFFILFLTQPFFSLFAAVNYWQIADFYYKQKKYDQAVIYFSDYIKKNPNDWGAYEKRGICYQINRQYSESIADFNLALELKKDRPLLYIYRGFSLARIGQVKEAADDFSQARAMDLDLEIVIQLASIQILMDSGQYGKAAFRTLQALKHGQYHPILNRWLCLAYYNQDNFQDSFLINQKIIDLNAKHEYDYFIEANNYELKKKLMQEDQTGSFQRKKLPMIKKNELIVNLAKRKKSPALLFYDYFIRLIISHKISPALFGQVVSQFKKELVNQQVREQSLEPEKTLTQFILHQLSNKGDDHLKISGEDIVIQLKSNSRFDPDVYAVIGYVHLFQGDKDNARIYFNLFHKNDQFKQHKLSYFVDRDLKLID